MAVFEDVRISWNEREYVIAADGVLRAIAKVEDVLTLGELAAAEGRGRIPLAKIATAYGALLRHAGVEVSDDEVYDGIFRGGAKDIPRQALRAITTLQALMIPPAHLRAEPGKKDGAASSRRAGSSRKSTSSSSASPG